MYFEDLPKGFTFETGSRSLSESDIIEFARQWDPQPFHIDPEAAAKSVYGGIIASGFHTLLVAFTLTLAASDWSDSSMGSPGMDEVRWLVPVRPGDTLRVRGEVLGARASASRPDRGTVTIRYLIMNQDDAQVAEYTGKHILKRKS